MNAVDFVKQGQYLMAKTVKDEPACLFICDVKLVEGKVLVAYKSWKSVEHAFSETRVTKHRYEDVIRAIEIGEWEPVEKEKVDPEMKSALSLYFSARAEHKEESEYLDRLVERPI